MTKATGVPGRLPDWAAAMRETFRGGTISQFIIHGNVHDLVPAGEGPARRFVPLARFLVDVIFEPFDVVLFYNRGKGLRAAKGEQTFHEFLQGFDRFNQTTYASAPLTLPRDPKRALEIVDRFLLYSQHRLDVRDDATVPAPIRVGIVIEHAQFIAPQGEALQLASDLGESVLRLLDWASDPAILGAHIATVLVTGSLNDVHRLIVQSPFVAKVPIELPREAELAEYVESLALEMPALRTTTRIPLESLPARAVGLSRLNIRNLVSQAVQGGKPLDAEYFTRAKRAIIEKECYGLLEFVESKRTLDDVSGHEEAKKWLREDAQLLQRGETRALPMGYLFAGRIGTGKTWLTTCWAGEIGIPCVVLKNFRDRWQGSTEGNLEKIFHVLHALGQVMVFVDEADQATGRRESGEGDSGVSGRVYAMLAKEMSDTDNRGRILWVFATSRPDLLEVDLKRAGRLDVHLPLFPPQDEAARNGLFRALAKKVGLTPADGTLPELPPGLDVGGNELESILVQARRRFLLQDEGARRPLADLVLEVLEAFRPSAHSRELEYMDLVAVRECTDSRFLPEKFRKLSPETVEARLTELRGFV